MPITSSTSREVNPKREDCICAIIPHAALIFKRQYCVLSPHRSHDRIDRHDDGERNRTDEGADAQEEHRLEDHWEFLRRFALFLFIDIGNFEHNLRERSRAFAGDDKLLHGGREQLLATADRLETLGEGITESD